MGSRNKKKPSPNPLALLLLAAQEMEADASHLLITAADANLGLSGHHAANHCTVHLHDSGHHQTVQVLHENVPP